MNHAAEPLHQEPSPDAPSTPSPATAHVIAMSELEAPHAGELERSNGVRRPVSPLAAALGDARHPLRHLKARLTVSIGAVELTVAELLGATEHQVLRLDRTVEQPVDVLLEGHVVARGVLVAVDEHFGVRITEVPVSLDGALPSSRKP